MNNQQQQTPSYATDPNTTFVQADPSNFRNIVQKLTGAPPDLSSSSKKPSFKLHERRQSSKKMELNVNNNNNEDPFTHLHRGLLVSPVSHLDPSFWARVSPHSARENPNMSVPDNEEEQKAIAEKGFYVLPSPRSAAESTPQLLPLFPLSSPNSTTTPPPRIQHN